MKRNPIQEKYLLFRVKHSNDPEAYSKLYDLYIDRIYRFVLFKVARSEDAEDITSEVFLKAWQYIRTSDKRIDNINALLYRMARNAVIDYYRSKQRTEKSLSEEEQFKQIMEARDIERELDTKIKVESVQESLMHLKDDYREVIVLKHVEGLSTNEIAEILQKSRNSVRVLLHRALKRLREVMGGKK